MRGQRHAPVAPYPGKDPLPIVQVAGGGGGPPGRAGPVRKISLPPGFDPRTGQPVGSRYTDWATRPTTQNIDDLQYMLRMIPSLEYPRINEIRHKFLIS
jgi:hypothetical protein